MDNVIWLGIAAPAAAIMAVGGLLVLGTWLARILRLIPTDLPPALAFEIAPPDPVPANPDVPESAPARAQSRAERQRLLSLCATIAEQDQMLSSGVGASDHLPPDARRRLADAAQRARAASAASTAWIAPLRLGTGTMPAAADVAALAAQSALAWRDGNAAWGSVPEPGQGRRWVLVGLLLFAVAACAVMWWLRR